MRRSGTGRHLCRRARRAACAPARTFPLPSDLGWHAGAWCRANLLLPALPASPEVAVTLCLACIALGRTSCCTPGWAGTGSPCPLPAGEGPRHVTGILPGGGRFSLRGTWFVCLESSRAGSLTRRVVWEHGCIPGAGAFFFGAGCPRGVGVLFGSCWPASRGAASLLWQCGCWHKIQPKL